jgi:hypothetical protein
MISVGMYKFERLRIKGFDDVFANAPRKVQSLCIHSNPFVTIGCQGTRVIFDRTVSSTKRLVRVAVQAYEPINSDLEVAWKLLR